MANTSMTVLLVQDARDRTDVLPALLPPTASGELTLTMVGSVHEALQRMGADPVDVALLDLSCPDIGGLEALRLILADSSSVPVVVLVGVEDTGLGPRAVQAGAQDYLVKERIDGRQLARCLHQAVERHRLLRDQAEQVVIASALARVGEELISSLSTPVLVERLCRLTTEVLGGDFTHTWFMDEDQQGYVPIAHYGDTPEMWELVRDLKVPHEMVKDFFAVLDTNDVFVSTISDKSPLVRAGIDLRRSGISAVLYIAVRRGREMIGAQACGYSHLEHFSARHERIAKGLVHLASLGLENARLFEELEESNFTKTYLTATMSHELRGTLGTVLLGSEDLLSSPPDVLPVEARQTLEIIWQQTRESADLIEATLEMYGSEAGRREPKVQISVADLVQDVLREVTLVGKKADTDLQWRIAEEVPRLRTEPTKLKMILKNLVANALKFTERGVVGVDVDRSDDRVCFSVRDSGIGIAAADLATIFEPFRQAHGRRSRRGGGSGMGLYIVHRLVEILGGSIQVESELGHGSKFLVWIPFEE